MTLHWADLHGKKRSPRVRSTPTLVDGIRFQSKLEAERYAELLLLQRAGEIRDLRLQVRFQLVEPCLLLGARRRSPGIDYVADFTYTTRAGREVIEDVKGHRTDMYKVKRHMMKAILGLDITEV